MPDIGKTRSYLTIIPFLVGLVYIQYFLQRHDSISLILSYFLVFALYLVIIKYSSFSAREIFILGIVSRVILIFALPNLSDDYYRFIWDGRLIQEGINPYLHIPDYFVENQVRPELLSIDLYNKLNSKSYFTIYPPFSQLIFWLTTVITPNNLFGSVVILRIILIAFDLGSIVLIQKLLRESNLKTGNSLIYALNPLVLLELTGNLHFEGVMIFFILAGIYFYQKNQPNTSSIFISLSIATKLVPLMFLPVFIKKLKLGKSAVYYFVVGVVLILTFLPFLDFQFIQGFSGSLNLFFRQFEFNGGIFFLMREVGFYIEGYDMIDSLGPWLSIIALFSILIYSIIVVNRKTDLCTAFIIILFIQLALATTVHPWYILPLLALSALTKFRFPLVWSALIFLSYFGYTTSGYEHSNYLLVLEYAIIIPLALFEIVKFRNLQHRKS